MDWCEDDEMMRQWEEVSKEEDKIVNTPVMAQSMISMAFLFRRPSRFPCCRTHGGRCPYCFGRASSTVAVGEETVALPQLQLLRISLYGVIILVVVAQRQFPTVLRTMDTLQFHFDKVIDVPVLQVSSGASWRTQLCSQGCTC